MPQIRHPLSGDVYDLDDNGLVRVERDGRTGWFTRDGDWVSGDLRVADPELCRWMTEPRLARRHRVMTEDIQ
jgi:hypothetical protein